MGIGTPEISYTVHHHESHVSESESAAAPEPSRPGFGRRHWGKLTILGIIAIPLLAMLLWVAVALNYTYSSGDRQGYVQKISSKGWICKTWEGELAQANVPGQAPQLFYFSVRSDSIARVIDETVGKRVALHYEQHKGVPTSCFGETEYYVNAVRVLDGPESPR